MFLAAYASVTILCTLLSIVIGAIQHDPGTAHPLQDKAYLLSEKFDPVVNLAVWTGFAALYFARIPQPLRTKEHARALACTWLLLALPVDFVFFVLIPNPISLSPRDFYVGQFPWIYLIYAAVFAGPLAAQRLGRSSSSPARIPATAPSEIT